MALVSVLTIAYPPLATNRTEDSCCVPRVLVWYDLGPRDCDKELEEEEEEVRIWVMVAQKTSFFPFPLGFDPP